MKPKATPHSPGEDWPEADACALLSPPRRTLDGMTPPVYPITSKTFPRTGVLEIPFCSVTAYDGNTAVLQPEGVTVPFDVSTLTQDEYERAFQERGRDVQVQGLVALDTHWMLGLKDVTFRPPYRKPLGVRVEGTWYYAWPLRWDGTPGVGTHTVVSLSN